MLNVTNLLFVMFVILQNKKDFLFLLVHLNQKKKCFDLIHVEIWGPYSIASIHGHKYFLTIVDDYSRYAWIFLLKQKSKVVKVLEHFVIFVQTQFETTIKIIRSDNGTEFVMTIFLSVNE